MSEADSLRLSSSDPNLPGATALDRRPSVRSLIRQERIEREDDTLCVSTGACMSSSEASIIMLTNRSSIHSTTPIGDIAPLPPQQRSARHVVIRTRSLSSSSSSSSSDVDHNGENVDDEEADARRPLRNKRPSVLRKAVRMMSLRRHSSITSQTSEGRTAVFLSVGRTIQRTGSQLRKTKCYHFFYLLALPIYTVIGALIFQALDGEADENAKVAYENRCRARNTTNISELQVQCAKMSAEECFALMANFTYQIETCFREWHLNNRTVTHSMAIFTNALVYAFSVYTTIGYGNMAADTKAARVATIFYGALGIPLFFAFIKEEGNLCRDLFISFYKAMQRGKRRFCKRRRQSELLRRQDPTPSTTPDTEQRNGNGNCLGVPRPLFGGSNSSRDAERGSSEDIQPLRDVGDKREQRSHSVDRGIKKQKKFPNATARFQKRQNSTSSLFEFVGSQFFNDRATIFLSGLVVFFFYIIVVSWFFSYFHGEFDFITSVYFMFNSVALIGFGDIFPQDPVVILIQAPFIVLGVVLFSMCYFILQEEIRQKAFEASRKARMSISKYGQAVINQARDYKSPWSRRNSPLFEPNSEAGGEPRASSAFDRLRKRRQSAPAISLTAPGGRTRFRDV